MMELAWPSVALCVLGVASYFINKYLEQFRHREEMLQAAALCKQAAEEIIAIRDELKRRMDRLEMAKIGRAT